MANSKETMVQNYLNLLQELPSSADHTALLYHLSYLYLAKFPRLKMILRECAVETQRVFASSEALLLKCVDTSNQMVYSLLPELKLAVEKDDTTLTTMTLEKAKGWITEIVNQVKEIVDRYEKHTYSVASCTSDVINENAETEKMTKEIEALEKLVSDLQMELRQTLEEIGRIEAQIRRKNPHSFFYFNATSSKRSGLSVLAAAVPFARAIVKSMSKPITGPVKPLFNQRAQLVAQRSNLKSQQYNIQVKLTDAQLKLTNMKTEKGSDLVHLSDVQKWLYQIQQTLIQHTVFWKSVQVFLEALNDETFANEHFIGESELKEIFLTDIDLAQEHWKAFGESCLKAKSIFILQDKNAYKFLDSSPSSLPLKEWKEELYSMNEEFNKIRPDLFTGEPLAPITPFSNIQA